jgi:hypothetical protein
MTMPIYVNLATIMDVGCLKVISVLKRKNQEFTFVVHVLSRQEMNLNPDIIL